MVWYAWALIALIVVSSALNVAYIGRPRKPLDPLTALATLVLNALIIWAIVELAR